MAVVLVVALSIQKRRQVLEVLLGLVQRLLQGAHLFELVGPPLPLVGEHERAQRGADGIRDLGQ